MAQRIKFSIIQSLFRLFSFLADKTNGLAVFAKPKILLGSVIIGLTACSSKTIENENEVSEDYVVSYEKIESDELDSIANRPLPELRRTMCYFTPPKIIETSCYEITPEIEVDSNYVYKLFEVEKKPEFQGGENELYKFIGQNLRYPVGTCYDGGMQGKVYIQFIIEKDGCVSNVEVKKSTVDSYGDKEAVRVIKSMPNWIPGENNGEKARVVYLIPINFKLQ